MTELQQRLLVLLKEIDAICEKHNIKYALFAGTALGAQRSGGFIPWDDDADIIMTDDNYERFIKVAPGEMGENRCLNCIEDNPDEYLFPYARYVDTSTAAIQRHTAFGGCDPGVKIDIFCAVQTYANEAKAEEHRQEIIAFSEFVGGLSLAYRYRYENFWSAYSKHKCEFEKLGREKYIRKYMKNLKRRLFTSKDRYVLFSGVMANSYIFDAKILNEIVYVPFEDTRMPISRYNAKFSEMLYGKGWMFSPNDISDSRHKMLLDLNRSYKDYFDILKDYVSLKDNKENAFLRKQLIIKEESEFRDVLINRRKRKNLLTELVIEREYINRKPENDSVETLLKLFEPYYKEQLAIRNRFFGLAIELDPQYFIKAMELLIQSGRFYEADTILKLNLKGGIHSLDNPHLAELKKLIDLCSEVTNLTFVLSEYEKAAEIISENLESASRNVTLATAKYYIMCQNNASENELNHGVTELENLLHLVGDNGDILTVLGMIFDKLGDAKQAELIWHKSISTVSNAYLLQMLIDKGFDMYKRQAFTRAGIGTVKSYDDEMQNLYKEELTERQLVSPKIKERAREYNQWNTQTKKPVMEKYKEYAEILLNYKVN